MAPHNNKPTNDMIATSLRETINISSNKCDRPTTTLERCRDQAMDNMHSVNEIHSRILALLNRMRGPEPRTGSGSDGDTEPRGMLVVHLEQLEYEAQRLGEIQADLVLLESLL